MARTEAFRAEMRRHGLDYTGTIIADGKLHRFRAAGDKAPNSWFVLHAGPPAAGVFGCWRHGIKETWWERNGQLSQDEWKTVRRRWCEAEAERERAQNELHAKARKVAARILSRAKPVDPAHLYLGRKGIGVHGELREYHGALVVPLRDANGQLDSLQFIGADGTKKFLAGGRVAGRCFTIADRPDAPLCVAEGYATAASVHEATGFATVAAMYCDNLPGIAQALRAKWPQRDIILAADDDRATPGNRGVTKATEAARAVGAKLAIPFCDLANESRDFNDVHRLAGLEEVRKQIADAQTPKESDDEAIGRLAALPPLEYER